jgi:DNA-binding MarR family transcriptional regulator
MKHHKIESLETHFAFLIDKANLYIKLARSQFFKNINLNITGDQFRALYILHHEDGINQRELAQIMLKDRPNITRLVYSLEKKGLIFRKIDSENNRLSKKVFITEEGKIMVKEILPLIRKTNSEMIAGLTDEQIDTLKTTLKIICNHMEKSVKLQI